MLFSIVIPTCDRPEMLRLTLDWLSRLDGGRIAAAGGGEVVVVDNASRVLPQIPERLGNGLPARLVIREENEGAAGRNAGVQCARGDWVVMLDDDSHPLDVGFVDELVCAPEDVGAIGAEIVLGDGSRERGGLPEVFVGCGVAIRRGVYLKEGGYDPSFGYYVEEYDLAARMILAGWRVVHSRGFRVLHRKVEAGRDMNRILRMLVRNNATVERRYAPGDLCDGAVARMVDRYRSIAEVEGANEGFARGVAELRTSMVMRERREMSDAQYDRFTGVAAARVRLGEVMWLMDVDRVSIVGSGKNDWVVRQVLDEIGVEVVERGRGERALVVGTMSPGPMLDGVDAFGGEGLPVVGAWSWVSGYARGARAAV